MSLPLVALRRLILIPLLVLAGCASGDIVVESNLGEKTIVKRKAIELQVGRSKEFDNAMIKNNKEMIEMLRGLPDESLEVYKKENEVLKLSLEIGDWYQSFRYTPIYEDLNGKKVIGEEMHTRCVYPNLSSIEMKKLSTYFLYETFLAEGKGNTVPDQITRKICSEFAEWKD